MTQELTKAIQSIEKNLPEYALPEAVTSTEEYSSAQDLLGKIKKGMKQIEAFRDFHSKPHYDTYKNIRSQFEPFLTTLEQKEKQLKSLMLAFYAEEKKRKDEEQKRLEQLALENAKEGEAVTVAVVNDIKTHETVNTKSTVRTLKKWRVVNIDLVPTKYLTVDKKLVDEDFKKGIVPSGIEVYEEDSLSVTI